MCYSFGVIESRRSWRQLRESTGGVWGEKRVVWCSFGVIESLGGRGVN